MQLGCIDWHWLRGAHASGLRRGSCSRKRHRGHRREASSLCPHRIMQFNDLNTVAFRRLPHLLTLRPHPFMPTFKRHPHRHPRRYDRRHRRRYELPRNHLLYGEKKEGTCNKSWKQTCTLGVNPSVLHEVLQPLILLLLLVQIVTQETDRLVRHAVQLLSRGAVRLMWARATDLAHLLPVSKAMGNKRTGALVAKPGPSPSSPSSAPSAHTHVPREMVVQENLIPNQVYLQLPMTTNAIRRLVVSPLAVRFGTTGSGSCAPHEVPAHPRGRLLEHQPPSGPIIPGHGCTKKQQRGAVTLSAHGEPDSAESRRLAECCTSK